MSDDGDSPRRTRTALLAVAMDLRLRDRSTPQLVSVQIADARDEVVKGLDAPALIAAIAKWRHRHTFLAAWGDVAGVGPGHITLRAGYERRRSPALRSQ